MSLKIIDLLLNTTVLSNTVLAKRFSNLDFVSSQVILDKLRTWIKASFKLDLTFQHKGYLSMAPPRYAVFKSITQYNSE